MDDYARVVVAPGVLGVLVGLAASAVAIWFGVRTGIEVVALAGFLVGAFGSQAWLTR